MTSLNILSLEMASRFLGHSTELINVLENTSKTAFSKVDVDDVTNQVKQLKNKADKVVNGGSSVTKRRIAALNKWGKKFDKTFINHLLGELGIEKIKLKSGLLEDEFITLGHGGHKWNPDIRLQKKKAKIPNPPVDDLPFKADIEIRYKYEWLPKKQTSSMFPENWDLQRIKEEIAYVYENTVAKGSGLNPDSVNKTFKQYKFKESRGNFNILIEVDNSMNIMNAYPLI